MSTKKGKRLRNHYNAGIDLGQSFDTARCPSCTIPDDTLTITELIARYQRGVETRTYKLTHDDTEFNFNNMDAVQRAETAKRIINEVQEFNERSKKAKKLAELKAAEEAAAAQKEAMRAEIRAEILAENS